MGFCGTSVVLLLWVGSSVGGGGGGAALFQGGAHRLWPYPQRPWSALRHLRGVPQGERCLAGSGLVRQLEGRIHNAPSGRRRNRACKWPLPLAAGTIPGGKSNMEAR